MPALRHWDLAIDVDDVLRSQAADPAAIRARRPELVALSQRALDVGRSLIKPAVLTRSLRVESTRHNRVVLEGGVALTGPLITEHLGRAETVVVMLCTIGSDLETAVFRETSDRLSFAMALDAVGSAAVYALSAAVCNQVEQDAIAVGLETGLPLSPGLEGWDVDPGQREIFSIIDSEAVGVVLSPYLEMTPLKSTTSVIGIGADMVTEGSVCEYCALRDTCRHRVP